MIKFNILKKKIMREGAIAAAIVAVLGLGAYLLSDYVASNEQEAQNIQSNIQSLMAESTELERKIDLVQSSIEEFTLLKADLDAGKYSLSADKAQDFINQKRKQFRLSSPRLDISAEQPLNDVEFQKHPTATASFRQIRLHFAAMSDLHAMAFITSLQKDFPGFIKISSVEMTRSRPITNEILVDVSKGGEPGLLNCQVEFYWIGITLKPKTAGGDPNATAPL